MVRYNVYEITTALLLKTQTTPTSCLFYIARRIGWTLRLIEEKSLIIPNNYRRNCACQRAHVEPIRNDVLIQRVYHLMSMKKLEGL